MYVAIATICIQSQKSPDLVDLVDSWQKTRYLSKNTEKWSREEKEKHTSNRQVNKTKSPLLFFFRMLVANIRTYRGAYVWRTYCFDFTRFLLWLLEALSRTDTYTHTYMNEKRIDDDEKKKRKNISGKKCLISLPVYRDMFSVHVTKTSAAHPSVPCNVIRIYETPIPFQKGLYMSALKCESNHYKRKYANPCDWRSERLPRFLDFVFLLSFFFFFCRAQMRNDEGYRETEQERREEDEKTNRSNNT